MISDKVQKQIIDLFIHTRNKPFDILAIVSKDNSISTEEFFDFLNSYTTKDGKGLKRDIKSINARIDKMIYELKLKGLSSQKISEKLKEKYIELDPNTIYLKCKKIFEEKGEEMPQTIRIKKNKKEECKKTNKKKINKKSKKAKESLQNSKKSKKSLIDKNELYNLRNSGLSLPKITDYYKERGLKVSCETIRKMCKEIYAEKGEKEPKYESLGCRYNEIAHKSLKLREAGLSFESIKNEFVNDGINISTGKIKRICNNLGKGDKYIGRIKRQVQDEEIYNLRKNGMSLKETTDSFQQNGIDVSYSYIAMNSNRVFKERGEKAPKSMSAKLKSLDNLNQQIYELRKKGYSFQGIKAYLEINGIKVGVNTVRSRCDEIFKEKGEEVPKLTSYKKGHKINSNTNTDYDVINKQKIIDIAMEVGKRKKATEEQLKIFMKEVAKKYKVDIRTDDYEEER